jgi:phosphoribosyl 1,2-cyclic phosphate phosphodiesterase
MTTTLTILGCGSSGGVPRIGNQWGACDPKQPRNRRRRCSVLVRKTGAEGETRVLIDTSPDLREQMLDAEVDSIDGVIFTHEHADHTHGIDELRSFFLIQRKKVKVWANDRTGTMLLGRFGYCFYSPPVSDYPPILHLFRIIPGEPVEIGGAGGSIAALPFEVEHGNIRALGLRIDAAVYTPDLNGVPEESIPHLEGLDLWIVDALKRTPHPSHFCLAETLDWIARLKPRRAVLTNLHNDLDYDTLARELPAGIEPAYDGMRLKIS